MTAHTITDDIATPELEDAMQAIETKQSQAAPIPTPTPTPPIEAPTPDAFMLLSAALVQIMTPLVERMVGEKVEQAIRALEVTEMLREETRNALEDIVVAHINDHEEESSHLDEGAVGRRVERWFNKNVDIDTAVKDEIDNVLDDKLDDALDNKLEDLVVDLLRRRLDFSVKVEVN